MDGCLSAEREKGNTVFGSYGLGGLKDASRTLLGRWTFPARLLNMRTSCLTICRLYALSMEGQCRKAGISAVREFAARKYRHSNRELKMQAKLQLRPADAGQTIISLSVPAAKARAVAEAIKAVLALAGLKVHEVNPEGDDIVSADAVFKEASPAMALRGFRGKMEWTQQELAEKLGTTQHCISAMECGKRPVSIKMAKQLEKVFNISYKVFL